MHFSRYGLVTRCVSQRSVLLLSLLNVKRLLRVRSTYNKMLTDSKHLLFHDPSLTLPRGVCSHTLEAALKKNVSNFSYMVYCTVFVRLRGVSHLS